MAYQYNKNAQLKIANALVKVARTQSRSPPPPAALASIPESVVEVSPTTSLSLSPRRPLPGRNRLHAMHRSTKKNRNSLQRNLRPLPGSTRLREAAHTHRQTIKHIFNVNTHKAKVDRVVDIIDAYREYLYLVKPIMANSILNMNKQNAKRFLNETNENVDRMIADMIRDLQELQHNN